MKYFIKVQNLEKKSTDFRYESEHEELPLSMIMNFLLFDASHSHSFDANFISKYSQELKRFQYFIQRLVGIQIENEEKPYDGRQWVAYINEAKLEWDEICEQEIKIKPSDSVHFNYEMISR